MSFCCCFPGFVEVQSMLYRGTRISSSRAFLHPFMGRDNLHIGVKSYVTKVRWWCSRFCHFRLKLQTCDPRFIHAVLGSAWKSFCLESPIFKTLKVLENHSKLGRVLESSWKIETNKVFWQCLCLSPILPFPAQSLWLKKYNFSWLILTLFLFCCF